MNVLYSYVNNTRIEVKIVVDRNIKNKKLNMRRIEDRILSINLELEKEMVHIIGVYAPQIGSKKKNKRQIRDFLDELIKKIPYNN